MNREQIYEQLTEAIPYLQRRECTPRVMSESGVDALLDSLIEIQREEEYERVCATRCDTPSAD